MTWWWVIVVAITSALPAGPPDGCGAELVRLDRARAAAFADGDPQRLAQVYTQASPLATIDAETIEAYRERGGRVRGAWLHLTACRVVDSTETSRTLEVTETLGRAYVRWADGSTTLLPRDRPTHRTVTLQLTPQGWRISGSQLPEPRSDQGS